MSLTPHTRLRATHHVVVGMFLLVAMILAGRQLLAVAPFTSSTPRGGSGDGLLIIASIDESRVDIVDEASARTIASVPVGKNPHEVRVSPDGRTAYVVAGQTLTAIDLRSRSVSQTFDLGEFSAHDVRVSRDGRVIWAACARSQTVLELDAQTGTVLKRLPTSRDGAWFVEIARDESKLYTPNLEGKSVSVITRANGGVTVLPLDYQAYGIDVTPDGRQIVVSGRGLAVIDTATDVITRNIATTPAESGRIRITPDGRQVVVAMEKSLEVFDLASGRRERMVALAATPKVMALSADGRRAYLTNPEDHSATIVDIEEGRVVATLKTGKRPDGIAWAPRPS